MLRARGILLLLPLIIMAQVHKSPMAGTWYPEEAPALEKLLTQAFDVAAKRTGSSPPRRQLLGLVVPHAGLSYSGIVAASAYRMLGDPKNVVLLGFSHRQPLRGVVAPQLDAYVTPLGKISVNREAVKELGFRETAEDRLCDHSVENQLPFLQRAAPKAAVIPLYVGELSDSELEQTARKLARRMERGDVVVASSDFTHYGEAYGYTPFPNNKELPRRLFQRAMMSFEQIGSLDVAAFDRYLSATGDTLCGRGPIRLLMAALALLDDDVYLTALDYLPSGELTQDYSLSVSYGALAFYPGSSFALGEAGQKKLLASARRTLDGFLATGKKEPIPAPGAERDRELAQKAGVFVTIKKDGQLRGCVGALQSPVPLHEAVPDRTLAAATEDPRFPPLTAKDGPVELEISVLTPLKKIMDWRNFRIGQGAVLVLDAKTGVLLPQVAEENGWNSEQFLENLAVKAGLDRQAYRDPRAGLYVYSAQVFGEASGGSHQAGKAQQ